VTRNMWRRSGDLTAAERRSAEEVVFLLWENGVIESRMDRKSSHVSRCRVMVLMRTDKGYQ
jgi:hypothetical protein